MQPVVLRDHFLDEQWILQLDLADCDFAFVTLVIDGFLLKILQTELEIDWAEGEDRYTAFWGKVDETLLDQLADDGIIHVHAVLRVKELCEQLWLMVSDQYLA